MNESTERAAFEAAISASPYERSVARFPDDGRNYAWPSVYREPAVNLAWSMWQARASQSAPSPVEDKDGARYRWLRSFAAGQHWNRLGHYGDVELDAQIDAAIRALAQEGAKE